LKNRQQRKVLLDLAPGLRTQETDQNTSLQCKCNLNITIIMLH
jgi:hypothetical protein